MTRPRLRVAQLVYSLDTGGAETVAAALARGLDPGRFETELVGLGGDGPVRDLLAGSGVPVRCLGKRPGLDLGAARRLRRLLADGAWDVVHAHNATPNRWAVLAGAGATRAALVVTEHNPPAPGARRAWRTWLRAVVGLRNAAIVGVAEFVTTAQRRVDPFNGTRYATIHNGIPQRPSDPAARRRVRRELDLADDARVVGMVGNLRHPKAHDVLLRAIGQLARSRPALRLVLVGSGPREDELRRLATELDLDARVRWAGHRDDVHDVLGALDVFALASRSEGMPLAILEAMSAGLPVVASDVGGVREILGDAAAGRVVGASDPAELASALAPLVDDAEAAVAAGRAARERYLERFTAARMVERYAALYESVAGGPSAS